MRRNIQTYQRGHMKQEIPLQFLLKIFRTKKQSKHPHLKGSLLMSITNIFQHSHQNKNL